MSLERRISATTSSFFVLTSLLALPFASRAMAQEEAPHPITVETVRVDPTEKKSTMGITVGIGLGLTYYTENTPFGTDAAIGSALAPGYALSIRASYEILPWLAIDARGRFLHNDGNAYVKEGALDATGGLGAVRLTLPIQRIQPYLLVGFGGYDLSASGKETQLVSSSVAAVEFGLGAIVDAGHGFGVGFEYTYSHLLGETLSTNPNADGGDPSTVSLFGQYRFGL